MTEADREAEATEKAFQLSAVVSRTKSITRHIAHGDSSDEQMLAAVPVNWKV